MPTTRAQSLAQTQQASGGPVPPMTAGKNAIINGGFDIWQRGTASQTPNNGNQMNVDRWIYYGDNGGSVLTQDTDVPTNPYFQYSLKSVIASTNSFSIGQKIEAANAIALAGQTITFSFWAKTTSGSATLYANAYYPSAKDNFASLTLIASNTMTTPTSTWTRYSTTFTLPSNVQNGLMILIGRGATANTSFYTGIQLELGSSATPFSRAGGTIQGELAACQRYYVRFNAATQYQNFGHGVASSTTAGYIAVPLPVEMRVVPTAIDSSAVSTLRLQNNQNYTITGLSIGTVITGKTTGTLAPTVASGLTAGNFYFLAANNDTSAYVGFTAEL